jgi:hypothetical protein
MMDTMIKVLIGFVRPNAPSVRMGTIGGWHGRARRPQTAFYRFNSSPEIIRLVVMMYVKYPLSLRNVEVLLAERGIDICHETVRFWWNRFGPMFAAKIRRKRVDRMEAFTHGVGISTMST